MGEFILPVPLEIPGLIRYSSKKEADRLGSLYLAMQTLEIADLRITLDCEGARHYRKVSYPVRYGLYSEIATPRFVYQFNRNGEVKFLRGRRDGWPHPAEWLKRTPANDWLYYSSGEYGELYNLTGEFYLPCPSYSTNSLLGGDPFSRPAVRTALDSLGPLWKRLRDLASGEAPPEGRAFFERAAQAEGACLGRRARRLHEILGCRPSVLPPDARHADYDVLPVVVADGCAANCRFCRVKSGRAFRVRDRKDVLAQIEGIRDLFGEDLVNYNSVFLADHDALRAGGDLLEMAALESYDRLALARSWMTGANLFLFGSADTLARAEEALFERLDQLPYNTYINVGLESPDEATLRELGKPVQPALVQTAFERMLDVNRRYSRIEVTANLVFGEKLPPSHLPAVGELLSTVPERTYVKGAAYLSPLVWGERPDGRERKRILETFRQVKFASRLSVYLYLILRL